MKYSRGIITLKFVCLSLVWTTGAVAQLGSQCAFNRYSGEGETCALSASRHLQEADAPGMAEGPDALGDITPEQDISPSASEGPDDGQTSKPPVPSVTPDSAGSPPEGLSPADAVQPATSEAAAKAASQEESAPSGNSPAEAGSPAAADSPSAASPPVPVDPFDELSEIAVVYTAEGLLEAVMNGTRHIEVREHLDLTKMDPQDEDGKIEMLALTTKTWSITGNCTSDTFGDLSKIELNMTAWSPGQCVIITDVRLMKVEQNLWLDHLYIRYLASLRSDDPVDVVWCGKEPCNLWVTNSTIQGNGKLDPLTGGLASAGGQIYADGVTVMGFRSEDCPIFASSGATVNLVNSNIVNNHPKGLGGAIVKVMGVSPDSSNKQLQNTMVSIENSTFAGNTAANELIVEMSPPFSEYYGFIYSDIPREVFYVQESEVKDTLELAAVPANRKGIDLETPWLVETQKSFKRSSMTHEEVPAPAPAPSFDMAPAPDAESDPVPVAGQRSMSPESAIGIGVGSAGAVALLLGMFALILSRSRAKTRVQESQLTSGQTHTKASDDDIESQRNSSDRRYITSGIYMYSRSVGDESDRRSSTRQGITGLNIDTLDDLDTIKMDDPGPRAPVKEKREFLESQLDSLIGSTVLGNLKVLGGFENRLSGGQAVVQISEEKMTRRDFAMKFFLSEQSFAQERDLYTDSSNPLGQFLPELRSIVDGATGDVILDAHNRQLPPCIIMEKGEPLDMWIEKSGYLDMVTGLQVLSHVAERLKDLHRAGYVHRDIKPGNLMFLPRTKRWTLIDFGCAAETGSTARTGFSLFYAAPEVVTGHYRDRNTTIVATEALDAWAVGILSLEMFCGKLPFDVEQSTQQTIKMIIGEERAPWEDPRTAPALLKPLGSLRRIVLGLLERDPSARMNMEQAQSAIKRLLLNSTMTVGSSDFEVQSATSSSQQPYTQNTEPENRLESVHE